MFVRACYHQIIIFDSFTYHTMEGYNNEKLMNISATVSTLFSKKNNKRCCPSFHWNALCDVGWRFKLCGFFYYSVSLTLLYVCQMSCLVLELSFLCFWTVKSTGQETRASILADSVLMLRVPFLLLSRQCRYYSTAAFFNRMYFDIFLFLQSKDYVRFLFSIFHCHPFPRPDDLWDYTNHYQIIILNWPTISGDIWRD